MKRTRSGAWAAKALGTLVVSWVTLACNSPTLPVPPPQPNELDIPDAELLADGEHVTLSGHDAQANAFIWVLNEDLLPGDRAHAFSGTEADATGAYEVTIVVDLRCARANTIDIFQHNAQGLESKVRTFSAPNRTGDASFPPASDCIDAGSPDAEGIGDGAAGGDSTIDAGDGSTD